ncbi:MAG: thioredoxin domain-containing protein [bacterium]|nr:thioredoxin domain-containing protein [bacterium]
MENKSSALNIPTAIIIAGAIIAGSVIYTMKPAPSSNQAVTGTSQAKLKPISASDHILGNPNAKIKIVEYSDPSCPFCKVFHNTMRKIMNEYGKSGDVAWVYRSFPIDKPGTRPDGGILHPNAGREAQAMECAAALGGNDKFWAYTNRFYEITPAVTSTSPDGLDQNELPKIAEFVGLDVNDFKTCLDSGRYKDKVEASYEEGLSIGIQGTPSSIIITPSGKNIPIEGAQPYEAIKQSIDALLAEGR